MIFSLRTLAWSVFLPFFLAAAGAPVDFSRDVQPLFRARCYGCHGPGQQMKALRLDRKESAMQVIAAGSIAQSKLIARITDPDPARRMPPAGTPLTATEVNLLKRWIEEGAVWTSDEQPHWSFQKVRRPPVPTVAAAARNPVDAFVFQKLAGSGIQPVAEADRTTLIRRLSFDLTGLPPTPAEINAFLHDSNAEAYEKLVDRLLLSPHYGERWARPWLDVARYADSDGYEKDMFRPNAWRWRQWVIESLNKGMPFDQFTLEQIAGDLLDNATVEQRVATGFHRNSLKNREAGVNRAEARFEETVDRTNTVATAWLGLSAGCAQCHDHKYDPISQREYYSLFALFDQSEDAETDAPLPGESAAFAAAWPEWEEKRRVLIGGAGIAQLQARWEARMLEAIANPGADVEWDYWLTELRARIDYSDRMLRQGLQGRTARDSRTIQNYFIANPGPFVLKDPAQLARIEKLRAQLKQWSAQAPALTQASVIVAPLEASRTYVAIRGDYRQRGPEVSPGVPTILGKLDPNSSEPERLRFARWLVSRENPLTARVTVNRIWQEFFGAGLVRTPEDFGTQGDRPTHPELLDWLAAEFMESGWNLRHLQRLIVTSAAYRRASTVTAELRENDPENKLLARQTRIRLTAEQIRDATLAVSGLLHRTVGGKSVRPPQPESVSKVTYSRGASWEVSAAPERYRRGIYVHYQRTSPYPQLVNFDAPDANTSCTRRRRSNSPLQALNLLNDPVFFEAAQALAAKIAAQSEPGAQPASLFRTCLGRAPSPVEADRLASFLEEQRRIFLADTASAEQVAPTVFPHMDRAASAALVAAGRALMNTDEFITRE